MQNVSGIPMENERNLMEVCNRLKEELSLFIESFSPLYPGAEKKVEELTQKVADAISSIAKAEGGEKLLATARHLESCLIKSIRGL